MVDMCAEKSSVGTSVPEWERQLSRASTALPSPRFSRIESPPYESEDQDFTLEGLPDDIGNNDGGEKVVERGDVLGDIVDEASSKRKAAEQVTYPYAIAQSVLEKCGFEKCMLFGLTLSALCQYHCGMSSVGIVCITMGAFALLMIAPGTYLYMVKGCRPEDCDEAPMVKPENVMKKNGKGAAVFRLAMYSLVFAYGWSSSFTSPCLMGGLSLAMFLPAAFLYTVEGCRPGDCDEVPMVESERKMDNSGSGVTLFWLSMYSFAFAYGLYSSCTFRQLMGGLSLVMLLSSAYLFVVDGSEAEDCDDD